MTLSLKPGFPCTGENAINPSLKIISQGLESVKDDDMLEAISVKYPGGVIVIKTPHINAL